MPSPDDLTQRYADLLDDEATDADLVAFLGKLEAVHTQATIADQEPDTRLHFAGSQVANGAYLPPAPDIPRRAPSPARRCWNRLAAVAAVVALAVVSGALFNTLQRARVQTPAVQALTSLPFATYLHGLAMVSATEGWAVGETYDPRLDETKAGLNEQVYHPMQGLILHYQNGMWTRYALNLPKMILLSVIMTAPDDGWISGQIDTSGQYNNYGPYLDGKLVMFHYQSGAWRQAPLPDTQGISSGNLFAGGAGDLWLVGSPAQSHATTPLYHEVAGTWSRIALPVDFTGMTITSVGSATLDDAWLAANNASNHQTTLYHWHAGVWNAVPLHMQAYLPNVKMNANNDGWVAGISTLEQTGIHARLFHYDGKTWRMVTLPNLPPPNNVLEDLTFLTPTDGWISGAASASFNTPEFDNPLFYHFDGTAWQSEQAQTPAHIYSMDKLAMISPTDGWAIAMRQATYPQSGGEGFAYPSNLLRYDGTRWQVALPDSEH